MLPWSTCGHTQGLVRIAPAKQYRMQLHVTTNAQGERREAAAADVRLVSELNGCLPFAPPAGSAISFHIHIEQRVIKG